MKRKMCWDSHLQLKILWYLESFSFTVLLRSEKHFRNNLAQLYFKNEDKT
jgi:hypothetical protein